MKKILGLIGSYRKLGNSELIVKEIFNIIINQAKKNDETSEYKLYLIRLPNCKILPCKACYACLNPNVDCKLDDDMNFILESINEANYIILAVPCYILGPAGIAKMIADRSFMSIKYRDEFSKKRTIIAATAGIKGVDGYTLPALNLLIRSFGLNLVESTIFWGASPGEVFLDNDNFKMVEIMADALINDKYIKVLEKNECPTCWSKIYRKKEDDSLECIFCGRENIFSGEREKKHYK